MPPSSGKDLPAVMAALGADIVGVLTHGLKSKERRVRGRDLWHVVGGGRGVWFTSRVGRELTRFFPLIGGTVGNILQQRESLLYVSRFLVIHDFVVLTSALHRSHSVELDRPGRLRHGVGKSASRRVPKQGLAAFKLHCLIV